jgi:TRAP-type mannitol/chloroaromatic compound transport system substrate-binding protein
VRSKLLLTIACFMVLVTVAVTGCTPATSPEPGTPGTPTAPAEKAITWKVQTSGAASEFAYKYLEQMCAAVTKGSEGRLVFEPYSAGAIVPASKEFDGVDQGMIHAAYMTPMYLMDKWPSAGLFGARPAGLSAGAARIWYRQEGTALFNEMIKDFDAVVLPGVAVSTPEIWAHSTKELKTVSDLKGLKMRTAGDGGAILSRLGVATVSMPGGDIYESLQRGVIDAAEAANPANNWAMGLAEVAKYVLFSETRAPCDPVVFIASKSEWAKLNADQQALVQTAVQAYTQLQYEDLFFASIAAVENFRDFGCVVYHTPADIEAALLKEADLFYKEKAAADPFLGKVYASQQAFGTLYNAQLALDVPAV